MAGAPPSPITPKFLFDYPLSPNVNDYRCVVNAAGDAVIVERTVLDADGGKPHLYIADLAGGAARPFLKSVDEIATGETTRPDWCWRTGQVAFNYSGSPKVGVVDVSGLNPRLFPNTATMNYPTWFPDGDILATDSGQGSPNPNTTTLDPNTGKIITQALEGTNLFGGMPSVNPAKPHLIAFAGQPVGSSSYNQDRNYIWVKDISRSAPAVPLEYNAPATGDYCPAFQGRAPWWSPDGKWVVFESNRGCVPSHARPDGMYAIYLYEWRAGAGFRDYRLGLQLQSREVVSDWISGKAGRSLPTYCRGLAEWRLEHPVRALRPVRAGSDAPGYPFLIVA